MEAININNPCIEVNTGKTIKKANAKQFCLRLLHAMGQNMNLAMLSNFK